VFGVERTDDPFVSFKMLRVSVDHFQTGFSSFLRVSAIQLIDITDCAFKFLQFSQQFIFVESDQTIGYSDLDVIIQNSQIAEINRDIPQTSVSLPVSSFLRMELCNSLTVKSLSIQRYYSEYGGSAFIISLKDVKTVLLQDITFDQNFSPFLLIELKNTPDIHYSIVIRRLNASNSLVRSNSLIMIMPESTSELLIEDCSFTSNFNTLGNKSVLGVQSTSALHSVTLSITNCVFNNNAHWTSSSDGTILRIEKVQSVTISGISITNTRVLDGALAESESMLGVLVQENLHPRAGDGLLGLFSLVDTKCVSVFNIEDFGSFLVSSSVFSANSKCSLIVDLNTAESVPGQTLTFEDVTIEDCQDSVQADLQNNQGTMLTLNRVSISNCQTGITLASEFDTDLEIIDSAFTDNTSKNATIAVAFKGRSLKLINSVFARNQSPQFSVIAYKLFAGEGQFVVQNCKFIDNAASYAPVEMHLASVQNIEVLVSITYTDFSGETGQVLNLILIDLPFKSGSVISNCVFHDISVVSGELIKVDSYGGALTIENCQFKSIRESTDLQSNQLYVIVVTSGNPSDLNHYVMLKSNTFSFNQVDIMVYLYLSRGVPFVKSSRNSFTDCIGHIHQIDLGTFIDEDSSYSANVAGEALIRTFPYSTVSFTRSRFFNNYMTDVGLFLVNGPGSVFTMSDLDIYSNVVEQKAVVLYAMKNSTILVSNCRITGNSARTQTGVFYFFSQNSSRYRSQAPLSEATLAPHSSTSSKPRLPSKTRPSLRTQASQKRNLPTWCCLSQSCQ
jgi:hypothetical protein